jgi:hypothetical protein
MRLYCRSITLACEAYMGNPGLNGTGTYSIEWLVYFIMIFIVAA